MLCWRVAWRKWTTHLYDWPDEEGYVPGCDWLEAFENARAKWGVGVAMAWPLVTTATSVAQ